MSTTIETGREATQGQTDTATKGKNMVNNLSQQDKKIKSLRKKLDKAKARNKEAEARGPHSLKVNGAKVSAPKTGVGYHVAQLFIKDNDEVTANQAAYDRLFKRAESGKDKGNFLNIRQDALETIPGIKKLRSLAENAGEMFSGMSAMTVPMGGALGGIIAAGAMGPLASPFLLAGAAVAGAGAGALIGITISVASVPTTWFVCESMAQIAATSLALYAKAKPWIRDCVETIQGWWNSFCEGVSDIWYGELDDGRKKKGKKKKAKEKAKKKARKKAKNKENSESTTTESTTTESTTP